MPDEENKILKFPEPPPEDKLLWQCKACDHKITESMEEANAEGSKVLPLNMGGMMVYVCPNCRTFQLPEEVFNEVMKKASSKIITQEII